MVILSWLLFPLVQTPLFHFQAHNQVVPIVMCTQSSRFFSCLFSIILFEILPFILVVCFEFKQAFSLVSYDPNSTHNSVFTILGLCMLVFLSTLLLED